MSSPAHEAWMRAKGSPARSAFVAGYESGAHDERRRIAAFISENRAVMNDFAGARVAELVSFMLREMTPEEPTEHEARGSSVAWTDLYTCPIHGDVCKKQGLDWDCNPSTVAHVTTVGTPLG